VSEPLNSAQTALANGIAERVVAAIREDQAGTPVRILQTQMARRIATALHSDESLRSLAQFGAGHNRGPPLDDEVAVFSVPEFCAWAKISRSTLYQMWEGGVGPKFFKAGTAVRITRRAAKDWLISAKPPRRPNPFPKPSERTKRAASLRQATPRGNTTFVRAS
jgi:hypothetical protein